MVFSKQHRDEDLGVTLLNDIRRLFGTRGVDRFSSADLVTLLGELADAPWSEFRGVRDDQYARPLSQHDLARLLREFGIAPKAIWPHHRHALGISSFRGYQREQFEETWRSYCDEPVATAPPLAPREADEEAWHSPLE